MNEKTSLKMLLQKILNLRLIKFKEKLYLKIYNLKQKKKKTKIKEICKN